ncbi:unnamed protein product [Ilex paraguariensis]|uniref:Uncharacterized protein n=1 Tax=Ilex paraguariensis TaxID=185542 RepID=A0ABC8SXL6_9AQUA
MLSFGRIDNFASNWDLNRRISPVVQQRRKKKRVSSSANLAAMNRRGSRGYSDRCVVSPMAKVAVCSQGRPKLRLPSYQTFGPHLP